MFNCRNCGKAYDSRKRYIEHIEVCEEDIQSLLSIPSVQSDLSRKSRPASSVATPTSRQRQSEGSIRQDGKLRRAVADLMDERTRLKGELGKSETDLRERVHAHREDITSTQEYYQGQVISLMSERDELADQLQKRDDIIHDREKKRLEMTSKLATQRKKLESYDESTTKQSSALTIEVTNLQNKLAEQCDEQERKCNAFIKQLADQEGPYREQIAQITEHLKTSNQTLITEREEMRQMIVSKNDEEITSQHLLADKNDKMVAEQNREIRETAALVGELEKRIVKEREISKTSINNVRSELEEKIRERELSIRDMQSAYEKNLTQMVDKLESVEIESKKVISRAHAKNLAETQEQILKLEMSNASVLESNYSMSSRKIEESEEEVARIRKKLLDTDKFREDAVAKKERDVRLEQTSRIDELNRSILCHQEETTRAKVESNTAVEHLKTENSSIIKIVKDREIIIENLKRELENQRTQYETTARTKVIETNTFTEHLKIENSNIVKSMKDREIIVENLKRKLENQRIHYDETARAKVTETNTYTEQLKTENSSIINSVKDREIIIENLKRELENQYMQYEATTRAKVLENNTVTDNLKVENSNLIKSVKEREIIVENLRREFENQCIQHEATARVKFLEYNTDTGNLKLENTNLIKSIKEREIIVENLRRELENQRMHYEATAHTKLLENNTVTENLKIENNNMIKAVKESGLELTRIASETSRLRSQFITNLNIQQTDLENAVKERELIIENLRSEFKNQHMECETKIALANSITRTHADSESREVARRDAELKSITVNINTVIGDLEREREAHAVSRASSANAISRMRETLKVEENTKIANLTNQYEVRLKQLNARAEETNGDVLERLKLQKRNLEIDFEKVVQFKQNDLDLLRQAMDRQATQISAEAATSLNNLQHKLNTALGESAIVVKNQQIEISLLHEAIENDKAMYRHKEAEWKNSDNEATTSLNNLQHKLNTALSESAIVVQNQQIEISLLHEAIENDKAMYSHKEAERKKSDNESLKELRTESEKKILGMTSIIDQQKKHLNIVRNDFKDKMNDQTSIYTAQCMEVKRDAEDKLARKDDEVSQLRESIEHMHKDQNTLLDEQAILYECSIAHKEDEFTEKMATLNAREAEITAKSSDSNLKIKKIREDCIEKLKKGFVEIDKLNATNSKLNEDLHIIKTALDSKHTEIQYINETHDKLKNSFLVNINNQKCAMERTLKVRDTLIADRDVKISKLEDIISKNIVVD
jgi:hypothetical protein